MPIVLTNNVGQFVLRWTEAGDPEEQVITCGYFSSAGLAVDVQSHADKIGGEWLDAFPAASFSDKYTFRGASVLFRSSDSGLVQAQFDSAVAGTGAPNPLPSNCAFLVRKTTTGVGRKHKGRWYVPPFVLPELNVDQNGMLGVGDIPGVQTRFTAYFDALVGAPAPPINPLILHSDGTPSLPADTVTGLQLQPQIATQRRRMR